MADTKVSALAAVAAALLTHELPVNEGGVSKKVTLDQILALDGAMSSAYGPYAAPQGPGFAADTYLTGSRCLIPAATGRGSLKSGSIYRCKIPISKTAAGTAAPTLTVRFGTAGTTSDATIGTINLPAQTAAADEGLIELFVTWATVGSGTAAAIRYFASLAHRLSTTGLANSATPVIIPSSAGNGHSSQLASAGIGVSINAGASAAWTTGVVQAELFNLA